MKLKIEQNGMRFKITAEELKALQSGKTLHDSHKHEAPPDDRCSQVADSKARPNFHAVAFEPFNLE